MALDDPLQLVMIAVIAIVFLVWGPKKIPELARSLGLARKEFSNASKPDGSALDSAASLSAAVGNLGGAKPTAQPANTAPDGDVLIATAKQLGVPTEGRTREEVSEEILQRAKAPAGVRQP